MASLLRAEVGRALDVHPHDRPVSAGQGTRPGALASTNRQGERRTTAHPTGARVTQQARNLVMQLEGHADNLIVLDPLP